MKSSQNNEPQSIDGFDLASNPSPKEWIRDVSKSSIDPIPYFESKLINLSTGNVVLVAYVHESSETPHITKDGRIYRRNAEGSDPVARANTVESGQKCELLKIDKLPLYNSITRL